MNQNNIFIVFIDGYTLNGRKHIDVFTASLLFMASRRPRKMKIAVVCSMSSRYKAKLEKDMMLNLEQFNVLEMANSSPMSTLLDCSGFWFTD
jgi:hypothetical protein